MNRIEKEAAERQKKETERFRVASFFRGRLGDAAAGLHLESADPPEPDVWVQGTGLAAVAGAGVDRIGVEVTEYHAGERVTAEARWEKLSRVIDEARLRKPSLKNVAAWLHFKDPLFPKDRDHRRVAEALVAAVEAAVPLIPPGQRVRVSFLSRADVARLPAHPLGDWAFLAAEDHPVAAEHIDCVRLEPDSVWEWPGWDCPPMLAGWNGPSADGFRHILERKRKKAAKYDPKGRPLWLLIVAEVGTDRESHVFPRGEGDLAYLREQVCATGFDFAASPFQQVWLFSEFTGGAVLLYAASPAAR
jgi:hypothetical protein